MYEDIATGEIINTLKGTHQWKLRGIDKVPNFLLHISTNDESFLQKSLKKLKIPDWLTERVT